MEPVEIVDITDIEETAKEPKKLVNDPIQRVIFRHIYREQRGCMIGITGRAGFGKTYTANKIIKDWDEDAEPEEYLCHSIDEALEKILLSIKINGRSPTKEEIAAIPQDKIVEWCKDNIDTTSLPIGKPFLIDEAGVNLYNRNFFSAENKAMSQVVQIWRYMRMLVIFIVAERFSFLEKTMLEFLDLQIIMTKLHRHDGYAEAIVKERYGRNPKGEPAFKNVLGCRERGHINIISFSRKYPADAKKYRFMEDIFKYSLGIDILKDLQKSNTKIEIKAGKKPREIVDITPYMEEARKVYKVKLLNSRKRIIPEQIMNHFGVPTPTARRIKVALEQEIREGRLT